MNVRTTKEFAGFKLDPITKELSQNGERVALSPKEAEILCLLVERPGLLVTKDAIVDAVWKDSYVEESNLSRQIYMLRKRLSELGAPRDLIENVPKRGYRFKGTVLNADHATVIEKHVFTQTLLEELEDQDRSEYAIPEAKSAPGSRFGTVRAMTFAAAAFLSVVASVSLAAWQFGGASARTAKTGSLAVIPFKVIGTGDESSGAAIADLLITRLSSLQSLKVRPTTAVIGFDFSVSSVEFGTRLGVDSVLEGTVVRSDEGHRVTARLIDVSDGNTIWSDEFAAEENAILGLHDEIAKGVIAVLASENGREQSSPQQLTNSEEAFRYYTKARYQWNKRNNEGMNQAGELFRKAIDADPNFVLAKVGLAETVMMGYEHEQATRLLNEAETADPTRGQIFAAKGFIDLFHRWQWDSAENNFKRAIELNPGHHSAYQWYAILLSIEGRHEEAKTKMHSALEIDPVSPNLIADLGQIYYFAGEMDTAEQLANDALAIAPDFTMAQFLLADIYFQRREIDRWANQAIRAGDSLASISGGATSNNKDPYSSEAKLAAYKRGGIEALEELWLREGLLDTNANRFIHRAKIYARRGDSAAAIESLESALSGKAFLMPFVKQDPIFQPLRQHSRFRKLLQEMSL